MTKMNRFLLLGALLSMVPLSGAAMASSPNNPDPANASDALEALLANLGSLPGECPSQCEYGGCWGDKHKNQTHEQGTNAGTLHGCEFSELGCLDHKCESGCEEGQDCEPGGGETLVKIESLLRLIDGDDLMRLAHSNERLQINHARNAVQLLGCPGVVLVSVALPEGPSLTGE